MADETKTPAARLIEKPQGGATARRNCGKETGAARAKVDAALKAISRETSAPPPPMNAAELQIDSEIRARLSSMKAEERDRYIAKAIETGDDATVRAILTGPAWVVGLSDSERELRRHAWRSKKFPTETDRESRLNGQPEHLISSVSR